MQKILFLITIALISSNFSHGAHLKGGWIQYEYLGAGAAPNTSKYRITIRQYLLCSSSAAQIDPHVSLGIFDAGTNALDTLLTVDSVANGSVILNKTSYNPCLTNRPPVCYLINKYVTIVDLPDNDAGYTLAVQRCCRIGGIVNVDSSAFVGITYSNKIPGGIYRNNNSPSFVQKDTVLVCYNENFTFDFGATDADGDSLAYSFCDGLAGGSSNNPSPNPPSNPPFTSIPYSFPFTGGSPLGSSINIDHQTGVISGIAPSTPGDYVVAVCAQEYRGGVLIGSTKKEIHMSVGACSESAAKLNPVYINCNNLSFTFFNESTSSNVTKYLWDFGDGNSSSLSTPTHNYSDTGVYNLGLIVTTVGGCMDSSHAHIKVYPGFTPKFTIQGNCYQKPFIFTDATYTKYGVVNNWNWNFGDTSSVNNTANTQQAIHSYSHTDTATVILQVSTTEGCTGNDTLRVAITDSCIDLPVTLDLFTAVTKNKTIQTNWHTATELNTSHFIVQHSTDGNSFTDIGTIKAIGSGANSYSFTDETPTNGINYYRLKSVDKDGSLSFSKLVSASLTTNNSPLTTIYPNPAKDNVTIKGNHISSVQVFDNMGRVVKVVSLKDATNPVLSVNSLAAGVYHLRVETIDGKVSSAGLMVND